MKKLSNAQRAAIFKSLADARAPMRYGEVSSYDPVTYSAKVIVRPEGIETGWLPILAMGCGGGFGNFWGLLPPAQVALIHFEGDRDNGLVIGVTPNSTDQPPQVPGGEMWMMHQSGSYLKFTNDGKVSVHGTVLIQIGNLTQAIHKFVIDTFESLFNSHTHSGVSTGSGNSGAPNQTMGNSHLSSITQGN